MNVQMVLPASCLSRPFHARQDDLRTVAQQAREAQELARQMIDQIEAIQRFMTTMHNAGILK